jgi:hypothetical protein
MTLIHAVVSIADRTVTVRMASVYAISIIREYSVKPTMIHVMECTAVTVVTVLMAFVYVIRAILEHSVKSTLIHVPQCIVVEMEFVMCLMEDALVMMAMKDLIVL